MREKNKGRKEKRERRKKREKEKKTCHDHVWYVIILNTAKKRWRRHKGNECERKTEFTVKLYFSKPTYFTNSLLFAF